MSGSRLEAALEAGLTLPEGPVAVFAPRAGYDLAPLGDRARVIQGFRPDHDAFAARGTEVAVAPEGRYAAAVVVLPRAKAEARALIALACAHVPEGAPVVVDGLKADGVDSVLKLVRARVPVSDLHSKAHGKIFAFPAADLSDWAAAPAVAEGFAAPPGAFSAGEVDPGSALLASALPSRLPARVADLGAGWGWLAAAALAREGVRECHLVEADHASLEAARANVTDPRARFHWADVAAWAPEAPLDMVLTNPPFHAGRAADPALGQGFIAAAARVLAPGGRLLMVANRHLPYERALGALFAEAAEIGGNAAFKVILAQRPLGKRGRAG